MRLINHDILIENGKTVIKTSPIPLYFDKAGKIVSTKNVIDRCRNNPRNETALSKMQWELMDMVSANHQHKLNADITLDGDHPLVEVKGRSKEIEEAESLVGIQYPMHFAWIDGAETTQGVISFPDDKLDKVYVIKNIDPNEIVDPIHRQESLTHKIIFLEEQLEGQELQRPYYTRVNGLINVYMDGFSGAGTAGDPYQITTWAELADMNNHLSSYFILMNNLSSSTIGYSTYASSSANSGAGWLPIGNTTTDFTGNFEGQGFTISNIYINRPSVGFQGLFGVINSTLSINNIGVLSANITGQNNIGILCGYQLSGNFQNCRTSGQISGVTNVGGVFGQLNAGTTERCFSTANVTGSGNQIGGFSGALAFVTIRNCYAQGSVTCSGSGNVITAGFAGYLFGTTILNCYSTGAVTASGNYIGGFSAYGTGPTNCFWDTQTSGQATSTSGAGKTTAEMKTLSTFTGASWSIANKSSWVNEAWFIDATVDYPRLGWQWIAVGPANLKTLNGALSANIKTINGLLIASIKSVNALT